MADAPLDRTADSTSSSVKWSGHEVAFAVELGRVDEVGREQVIRNESTAMWGVQHDGRGGRVIEDREAVGE